MTVVVQIAKRQEGQSQRWHIGEQYCNNTLFLRALYFRANSRISEIHENVDTWYIHVVEQDS